MFAVVVWLVVVGLQLGVIVAAVAGAVRDAVARVGGRRMVRPAVRFAVRSRGLRVVRGARSVRRGAVLRVRLAMVDVRRRWGFLRGASVLTWVCVPVWMTRYQIRERVTGLGHAVRMLPYAFLVRIA